MSVEDDLTNFNDMATRVKELSAQISSLTQNINYWNDRLASAKEYKNFPPSRNNPITINWNTKNYGNLSMEFSNEEYVEEIMSIVLRSAMKRMQLAKGNLDIAANKLTEL